jgi:hypothetical protein
MQDDHTAAVPGGTPPGRIAVSPDNPCPFLRALVAGGFVDGHVVPLPRLTGAIEAASGENGLKKTLVGLKTYQVALIANGLSPLRLLRSWWSGAVLDELRDGPLDKHGAGSRILDNTAYVNESELARLAEFGKDRPDPSGAVERGLTAGEIKAYMDANFERARGHRRWYDRLLMEGEWPVLLNIMGKGDGDQRYLSVAEVRALFLERRLPSRIAERLASKPTPVTGLARVAGKVARWAAIPVVVAIAAIVVVAEFPDQLGTIVPPLAQFLPPPLPTLPPIKEAHWLDQNWSTEDRHWFHHASQGTATFPVPYTWFMALEQPGIHLVTRPGLLNDSHYLERFGFLPSPKTIHTDQATLHRFGYYASDARTEPAPQSVSGMKPTPAENFDGLPVGFARMPGAPDPTTGQPGPDMIGLTCAACHTGHINYQGKSVRFDGGQGMVDLLKLELATGQSIGSTLYVPGRFRRFATRVLGPNAAPAQRDDLEKGLSKAFHFVLAQAKALDRMHKDTHREDTLEGYGRLDALNRIGNQVFATDMAISGLEGFDKNLAARDAPVSFPPIWTVPWFLFAQYDASIEQPLIRNAGEALGVFALLNLSPDYAPENLFRSSMALENLVRIEAMLRGPDLTGPSFGGLQAPKWPSQLFPNDEAWKINEARVPKGRALYAEICAECHLGPVNDPLFDKQFPAKSFWSSPQWDPKAAVLIPVQKTVAGMGTDPAQANVLFSRMVDVPGFLKMDAVEDLAKNWGCQGLKPYPSSDMPFSIALMIAVDRTSRKWMDDHHVPESDRPTLWEAARKNCPNPVSVQSPHYRARPLNGVWATAPYLHNGSVPSLYLMLMPATERPTQFCLGSRDYDPKHVGLSVTTSCAKGETLFSVTAPDGSAVNGNSVLGHSLEGTPGQGKPGVIGRLLTDEERYDLIEYLKTL